MRKGTEYFEARVDAGKGRVLERKGWAKLYSEKVEGKGGSRDLRISKRDETRKRNEEDQDKVDKSSVVRAEEVLGLST